MAAQMGFRYAPDRVNPQHHHHQMLAAQMGFRYAPDRVNPQHHHHHHHHQMLSVEGSPLGEFCCVNVSNRL